LTTKIGGVKLRFMEQDTQNTRDRFEHPHPVSRVDMAFGGNMADLMPDVTTIPPEFNMMSRNRWVQLVDGWFFNGLTVEAIEALEPKEGIDGNAALGHVMAIMRSFEPKHEDKIAACAYLMGRWFT
jgi:hypothetical protein